MRSFVTTVSLAIFTLVCASPALAGQRVALVIGNSAYQHVAILPNPINDSADMAAALERIGFHVTLRQNLDYEGMRAALRDFGRDAVGADMALIYYAGHGLEIDKHNYLVPVDARLSTDLDVEFEAVPLELLLNAMIDVSVLRLVLLDACRDNPFVRSMRRVQLTRSIGRGLSPVEPAVGTLVGYAAKDGTTAEDGSDRNSPYTTALLAHLDEPGLDIQFMFRKVRDAVMATTHGRQEPYVYGSLPGQEIYLRPPAEVHADPSPSPVASDAVATEIAFWNSVKDSDDPWDLESYIRMYPNGTFADLAKRRLEGLARQQSPEAIKPSATLEPSTQRSLAERVQRELRRVGCNPGSIDGIWGQRSREALRRFIDSANISSASLDPSTEVLGEIVRQTRRVCPQVAQRSTAPPVDIPQSSDVPTAPTPPAAAPPAQVCREETREECRARGRAAGARRGSGFCRTRLTICN